MGGRAEAWLARVVATARVFKSNGVKFDLPIVTGIEPVDGTWFDISADPPVDAPLIVLIPVARQASAR